MRGRRLAYCAAHLVAAAGLTVAAMPRASAATGASELPILFANLDEQAHQCTVIGSDSNYQAVACADLVTSQGLSDYYVHAQVEA